MVFNRISRRAFVKGSGLAALAGAATTLAGCGGAPTAVADTEKVLRWAQSNAKQGMDMQKSTNSGMSSVSDPVVESLLRFTEDNELVPCLLTEIPTVEDDGVTYHCTLKEGIKCHDGSTLTANDVKFSFTRMFLPETAGLSTYMYDMIVGAQDVMDGKTTDLAGLTVEDDTHFTFTLQYPMAAFVKNLGINYANVFPEGPCTEAGDKWGYELNYVGSGPFKLVENDDSTFMRYERFEDYHGDPVALDGLTVTFIDDNNTKLMSFKNGDIDMCDLSNDLLKQYKDDPEVGELISYNTPLGTWFVNLNLNTPALQDVRVRQALSLAIDRQAIVDTVFSGAGVPASGFLNQGVPGFDPDAEVFEYNPEKAKQLLAEAGATGLSFDFPVRSRDEQVATALQEYWRAVGVTANINVIDDAMWIDQRAAGSLPCTLITWTTLCWVGAEHMRSFFYASKASQRSSFYDSPTFDELVDKAEATMDEGERTDLTLQADNQLVNVDFGTIPVDWPQTPYLKDADFSGVYRVYDFKFTNKLA